MESFCSTVAIVGGGASGALTAAQLLRQAKRPVRILLFGPSPMPEFGTAYTTRDVAHLLNVPAGRMSAWPAQPDHFLQWLNAPSNCAALLSRRQFTPADFVPRAIYARYIAHVVEEACREAADSGSTFERVNDLVADFEPDGLTAGVLTTQSGRRERVAHLVLALGNLPARDPLPRPHEFFRSRRYVANVWSAGVLEAIDPAEDLLVAGSGLTAMDVVATLRRVGHEGKITVVSRNGQLPASHVLGPPYRDFLAGTSWPASLRGWIRLVRGEMKQAQAEGVDWRPVFDALRPHTQKIWQSLSPADKQRALRHLRPYWESRRHRAPEATWAAFDKFALNGQLRFRPGRIRDFSEDGRRVTVTFQPKGHRDTIRLHVHTVLNCLGPESNFRQRLNDPLLVNLMARGTTQPDPLLLGLAATPDGAVIGTDGLGNPLISTLGPPLRGILWETTAIPEIRTQAASLAANILRGLFTPEWEI